jgi:nucleotide-binding universal stress UspA family protein
MHGNSAPQRFLLPVDSSASISEPLEVATRLARGINGSVTLLAVVPLAASPSGLDDVALAPGVGAGPEEQEVLDRLARDRLDEVVAGIGDGVDVRTEISWGPAGPAIVDQVGHGAHDLVVLSIDREGELGHLLHDHTLRHVLHHCPVPVLVVPATGNADQ